VGLGLLGTLRFLIGLLDLGVFASVDTSDAADDDDDDDGGGATKSNSDGWSDVDGDGGLCYDSFLDDTYLVDRKTTIREYLKRFPEVMATEPPESLRERYGG